MKARINISDIGNNKISAIKLYRDLTKIGLKESKDAVEKEMFNAHKTMVSSDLKNKYLSLVVDVDPVVTKEDFVAYQNYTSANSIGTIEVVGEEASKATLDFQVSMKNGESTLNFKGTKIEAKMTVNSNKMIEVVKWVIDNF